MRSLAILLLTIVLMPSSHAGTRLTSRDDLGTTTTVQIDSGRMRIETEGEPVYLLTELASRRTLTVSPEEKIAIESTPLAAPSEAPASVERPKVELKPMGDGPTIAGYPTKRYRLLLAGHACYDQYLAPRLLAQQDIRDYLQAIAAEAANPWGALSGSGDDPCTTADSLAAEYHLKLGLPLRTVAPEGTVISETIHIETGVTLPAGAFAVPAGFRVMTTQELMKSQGAPR